MAATDEGKKFIEKLMKSPQGRETIARMMRDGGQHVTQLLEVRHEFNASGLEMDAHVAVGGRCDKCGKDEVAAVHLEIPTSNSASEASTVGLCDECDRKVQVVKSI